MQKLRATLLSSSLILCSSVLSAAEWVKISIPKTGVYEITYDELHEMGFTTPENVGIIGRGGRSLPLNGAQDPYGIHPRVPVIHDNGKLYFYALGPDSFSFEEDTALETGGRFINNGLNIYSSLGYYYLTDTPEALLPMPTDASETTPDGEITTGVSFISHESDLAHNSTNTGNLYWGETFNGNNPSEKSWKVNLQDAETHIKGVMECVFYVEKDSQGSLSFGTNAPEGKKNIPHCTSLSNNLSPISGCVAPIAVNRGENIVSVSYTSSDNITGVANLDYWVLSYSHTFNNTSTFKEYGATAFPSIKKGESRYLKAPASLRGIDITNPVSQKLLPYEGEAFTITNAGITPVVEFFSTTEKQNKIHSWHKVQNSPILTTLSDLSVKGADLLIICPEKFISHAEKIADIHRQHDSMTVVTATLPQVYAEFSDGLPDPSACRHLIKMFYESQGTPLRNALFIGPFLSDVRGINTPLASAEATIAVQAPTIHRSRGAYAVPDFYGITTQEIELARMEYASVNIGVGVLPFYNDEDARLYIDKLERFLSTPDYSHTLNDWLYIGGTGDTHTHDWQAVRLGRYVDDLKNKAVVNSVLAIDAYDSDEARKKLFEYINAGKGFTIYIGHASAAMMGQDNTFLTNSHISSLGNYYLTFLMTAGCSTTVTDQGRRGIGESMIMSTPAGAIGGLVTLRETWSGQNDSFAKSFLNVFGATIDTTPTIGEIYASAKTASKNTNDLAFILMSDPALKIPLPHEKIKITAESKITPGEPIKISGKILTKNGQTDTGFNGNVIVKLAEPARNIISEDYFTKPNTSNSPLTVTYADNIAAMSATEATNGKFSLSLSVPDEFRNFSGEKCMAYVAAFDPDKFQGAASGQELIVAEDIPSPGTPDTTAPVIEDFFYDGNGNIVVTAYDNQALNLSLSTIPKATDIRIDGQKSRYTELSISEVKDNGRRCTFRAPLPDLIAGEHTATIEVSDQHGNHTRSEIAFIVGDRASSLTLTMEEQAVADSATFNFDGTSGPARLLIINPSGKVVRRIDATGNSCSWDRLDDNGTRLAPGLYRAVLLETSATSGANSKRNSPAIYVPLI